MKIIAGTLHGRNLKTPKGLTTRPVIARVREALFTVLGDMSGTSVLDLFAGTGAIGIEAISRGAESVVFIDSGAEQCAVIRDNLSRFGAAGEVIRMDFCRALEKLSREGRSFDFIFADPPYEQGFSQQALEAVCGGDLLSPFGIMAITVRKTEEFPERSGERERIFDRRYGDTRLVMYGKSRGTGTRSQETE
jgi:16S rRNA (guanine(966)-N(2))-methyltransferase RsmD